ncbi:MAG: hypothetical protein KA368_08260 [Acidobacteria bacterium]|nr:hypothetical protein [Acidobacteriota bacterium]
MKLSISLNLNDKNFEAQLRTQINDQLGKVIAETADALIAEILDKKLARLTDVSVDNLALKEIRTIVQKSFTRPSWEQPSAFEKILLQVTKEQVAEALKK